MSHTAEVAFTVRDDMQNKGIGSELLNYLILLGKRRGLLGLTAEALIINKPMLLLFERAGFEKRVNLDGGEVFDLHLSFMGGNS